MATETRCEKCGSRMATFSTLDLCPGCMMREAIGLGDELAPRSGTRQDPGSRNGRPAPTVNPGNRIDRYRLRHRLGEGGMGVVYLAELEGPVTRRVALKVIKLGMDTKAVIARFEAERQALALMDHPNIAKIYDAGVTEAPLPATGHLLPVGRGEGRGEGCADNQPSTLNSQLNAGRPYFVMELVPGIRVTDYCEQHQCSLQARLDLFLQICRAVQHSHQNGIIHRDLKPSNILVAKQDGVPVPKIIDFGIAKAIRDRHRPDQTALTDLEQFVGTPAYMSPEQAGSTGLDLDTRSDVYSLGVLLYELLTGQPPFEDAELRASGLDAMCRTIRETVPPKPSSRLIQEFAASRRLRSELGIQTLDTDYNGISARRHQQLKELIPAVQGDLDWIVMKALEKERGRRYDSASNLAADIQRHLDHEPVLARPPSPAYLLQKLVRRNKVATAGVIVAVTALLVGLGCSLWLYDREKASLRRALAAEHTARAEAGRSQTVAHFLKGMLMDLNPAIAPGSQAKVLRGILDKTVERGATELAAQPEFEAELWSMIGGAYLELLDYPKAERMYREALRVRTAVFGERHHLVAASLNDLGHALVLQGRRPEGEAFQRQALALRRSLFGADHPEVARSLTSLAVTLTLHTELAEAEELQREALAIQRKLLKADHPDRIFSLNNLARLLWDGGRLPEAEAAFREALAAGKDDQNLTTSKSMVKLAKVLSGQGKLAEAEIVSREALDLRRRLLDNEHKLVSEAFHDLVSLLQRQGRFGEVEALFRNRLELMESQLPDEEPEIIHTLVSFTEALIAAKKFAEAEPFARESLALREKQMPGDWRIFISRSLLGAALAGQQKYAEAEPWLLSGYDGLKQCEATLPVHGRPYLRNALRRLAEFYPVLNRTNQAAEWQQKLAAFDQAAAEPRP